MAQTAPLAARLTDRYWRWLGRFVPPEMAADRERQNRALMFLVSHTIGPGLGITVPLALWVFDPTPRWDVAVLAGSIALMWGLPSLLRRGLDYDRLVLLSTVNLNFCILWSCYWNGGVASPTLPWVLVIPVLSLFYIGGDRRLQPHLVGITASAFVLFVLAYAFLPHPPNDIPEAAMIGLGAVSTVASLCHVATMAIYYARIFDAGMDLEVEMERRRAMTDELRRAVVAADRSGAARTEFLARMSHEIRTPLSAIIGYGEMLDELAEEAGDDDLRADVGRILDAGAYLARLINMILDLSKIEAGRMTFHVQPHEARALLEAAAAARAEAAAARGTRIEVEVGPGLDAIDADRDRLLQILDGLVENAVRHTAGGRVTLSAREALADGRRAVAVAVRDTGEGIAPDALPTLLEGFALARDASGGRYGGTGIGLTLCNRLAQAMGGSLAAESRLGEGATFTLTLPQQQRPAQGLLAA